MTNAASDSWAAETKAEFRRQARGHQHLRIRVSELCDLADHIDRAQRVAAELLKAERDAHAAVVAEKDGEIARLREENDRLRSNLQMVQRRIVRTART